MKTEPRNLMEFLKIESYKLTGQRHEILMLLIEQRNCHLNAEEIYGLLKQKNSGTGLATVYRTLSILEEVKLVRKIYLNDKCVRYQYADPEEKHEHHHLICECCGAIVDMHEDLLELLEEQILKNMDLK